MKSLSDSNEKWDIILLNTVFFQYHCMYQVFFLIPQIKTQIKTNHKQETKKHQEKYQTTNNQQQTTQTGKFFSTILK